MQVPRRSILAGGLLAFGPAGDLMAESGAGAGPGQDLAGAPGAKLVSVADVGGVTRPLDEVLKDRLPSVLGWIPLNLHAAIRAGTSTANVSDYVQAAIDEAGVVYFPSGRYCFNVVFTEDNMGLVGAGVGRQALDGRWHSGVIFWPADYSLPIIKFDPMAAGKIINFATLRDFLAFGWNDGPFLQTNGDRPTRRTDYVEITNVFVQRFGHGFDIGGGGLDWRLTGVHFVGCLNDGVHIDTGDSACNGWLWSKCSFTLNGRHGFYARKTVIDVEVSYSHTFFSCGSEYNGSDATEASVRGWVFENIDLVQMIGCTGENNRADGALIDVEFTGATARNILIDGFQSIGADRAIRFSATIQNGSIRNVRCLPRSGQTVSVEIVSGGVAPGGPKLVVDRHSVSGDITCTLGDGGRYDLVYADGAGPGDRYNLDVGWSSGVHREIDLRNASRILVLAPTAAREYGVAFTGLQTGAEYTIEVAGGSEPVTLPAALMESGVAYDIANGKTARFTTGGANATTGKLRPLWVSP